MRGPAFGNVTRGTVGCRPERRTCGRQPQGQRPQPRPFGGSRPLAFGTCGRDARLRVRLTRATGDRAPLVRNGRTTPPRATDPGRTERGQSGRRWAIPGSLAALRV